MSTAVKEKSSKVSSVKSLRKLTKQFAKHINTCKICKSADKKNVETNLLHTPSLCPKGNVRLGVLATRIESFERARNVNTALPNAN